MCLVVFQMFILLKAMYVLEESDYTIYFYSKNLDFNLLNFSLKSKIRQNKAYYCSIRSTDNALSIPKIQDFYFACRSNESWSGPTNLYT